MTQYDKQTVERIIEEVTHEVLLRLNQGQNSQAACDCHNGQDACADCVQKMAADGADRVTSRLGAKSYPNEVARLIDHTLLKANGTEEQIRKLCAEALEFNFRSVCVNPTWVALAAELLRDGLDQARLRRLYAWSETFALPLVAAGEERILAFHSDILVIEDGWI